MFSFSHQHRHEGKSTHNRTESSTTHAHAQVLPILLLTSCACAQTPPYPPSGFRPQEPFTLPPRQQPATFAPEVNQFGAREPQLQPQGQYLPPQSYRPALTTGLRPEEQYVPPRPFGGQQYFRPPSELELQISHVRALQNQNSIGTEEPRQPQTQYGAPTTEQNVPTQENFDDQRLRVNQQQQNRELGVQDEDRRPVVTRRVVQRRRKQQRGDQNRDVSEVSGLNNRPFNTYGVPTTARTVYLTRKTTGFRREPESTTRPAQQLRTTTVGTTEDEVSDVSNKLM